MVRTGKITVKRLFAAAVPALLSLAGCSSTEDSGTRSALPVVQPATHAASGLISHVVVIVQENRSFENFFAGYPGANAPRSGCAIPVGSARVRRRTSSGCPPGDVMVPLQPITFDGPMLHHNWHSSHVDYNHGKMDGFSKAGTPGLYQAYSFVEPQLITPYWTMAQQYVLADAMFPTEWGGSFTAHLTLVAGNDNIRESPTLRAEVDFPDGLHDDCDSPRGTRSSFINAKGKEHRWKGPFPCFTQFNTIAEVLDSAGVSWKYYADRVLGAGMWEPFEAIRYVRYGPDWNSNIVAPQSRILTDPANQQLASVTWVTPTKADSDHPGDGGTGPSWVASVVNAIGESSYWPTTAIVVVWDDWGGWYDNASPPQLDFRGLGFRVPCLIISPYAKQGYVSHVQYEYGSILKFIEEAFALGPIGSPSQGYTDVRANGLDDAFDFTQQPRPFVPIQASYGRTHFLQERPSDEPLDTE